MFDAAGDVIGGNATDQALMKFLGADTFKKLESSCTVTLAQSFNSANKFSQAYLGDLKKTFYKGAPERLLSASTKYLSLSGEERTISLDTINAKIDELANKSMRVLAFGYSNQELVENQIHEDTVIIGFVGIRTMFVRRHGRPLRLCSMRASRWL